VLRLNEIKKDRIAQVQLMVYVAKMKAKQEDLSLSARLAGATRVGT
jgi:hypothetical protein